jgi:Zn-dependent M28 family amino/carboxypeptidase
VFIKGLVVNYVGKTVITDIFAGTGKVRDTLVQIIRRNLKPLSFSTGKIVTVTCVTEHHPEGIAKNVIGWIEGSDPMLKSEVIILGAHLDHVGKNYLLMPGANDNASGDAVLLGTAEALSKVSGSLKRSVLFILFGAEEQGVKGSEFYVAHPMVPNANVKAFINLESVGRGEKISVGAGENYPRLWNVVDRNNAKYVHRTVTTYFNANLARPRQDAAHFLWANIPTIGIGTYDAKPLAVATYHTTQDKVEYITPEILEDIARLMFLSVVEMAR